MGCLRAMACALLALGLAAAVEETAPWDGAPRYQLVFPEGAGHADVRRYGATGDGESDDTAALQRAISDNLGYHSRIVYLPAGTYRVSATLIGKLADGGPMGGLKLFGQHRDRTVIRLVDDCPGFGDPAAPRPVIRFLSNPPHGDAKGNGNAGHFNSLVNLTVDTGSGNPGAIGVAWLPSNTGTLRDVTVRSGDGAGVMGVDLTMAWPGPGLGRHLAIEGFDHGMRLRHSEYGMTFHGLALRDQRVCGIDNDGNTLHIRDLRSRGRVPVIRNRQGRHWRPAQVVLLEAEMAGPEGAGPALENEGVMYLRDVHATGFSGVLAGSGREIVEALAGESVQQVVPSPPGSLKLPLPSVPHVPYDPPGSWAIVRDGPQAQAAIDAGATTLCFPFVETRFPETVVIRNRVRRIIGMGSNLWSAGDHPAWRYEGVAGGVTVMEWMASGPIELAAPSDCVLIARHQVKFRVVRNAPECGPLIIEDICGGPWHFTAPMDVWAYQWNPECEPVNVTSDGARIWCLGWKTERPGIQFDCTGGALELLGGLVYPCRAVPAERDMFRFHDTAYSVMTRWSSYVDNGIHAVKIRDRRGSREVEVRDITRGLVTGFSLEQRDAVVAQMRPARDEEASASAPRRRPAKPAPSYRPPSPELLARYQEQLAARVADEVARRRGPRFELAALGGEVLVQGMDAQRTLRVRLGIGAEASVRWDDLRTADLAGLALAVQRPREPEDAAMAAAFLFALGRHREARELLVGAGAPGRELLAQVQVEPEVAGEPEPEP